MSKFIGIVSAYAYAVSQGYTGTEEEYAELMASYATVAEEAAESAESAQASATTANSAASTATNKASEATTAAQTATDKAGEAQQSAQTATQKAGEAQQSAQTATAKASEAAQSASAAAESARTLTIDDTLTEPGQAADAFETGNKITSLKEDFNFSKAGLTQFSQSDWEQGSLSLTDGEKSNNQYRIRFKEKYVAPTDFVVRNVKGYTVAVFKYNADGTLANQPAYPTTDAITDYSISKDEIVKIVLSKYPLAETTVSDYDNILYTLTKYDEALNDVDEALNDVDDSIEGIENAINGINNSLEVTLFLESDFELGSISNDGGKSNNSYRIRLKNNYKAEFDFSITNKPGYNFTVFRYKANGQYDDYNSGYLTDDNPNTVNITAGQYINVVIYKVPIAIVTTAIYNNISISGVTRLDLIEKRIDDINDDAVINELLSDASFFESEDTTYLTNKYYVGQDKTYTTINQALTAWAQDNYPPAVVFIGNGEYNETVFVEDKTIAFVGESKDGTIVRTKTGAYSYPPFKIHHGNVLIANLTAIADHSANPDFVYNQGSLMAYAFHIDGGTVGGKVVIRNCKAVSYQSPAFGMGTIPNSEIRLEDVDAFTYTDDTADSKESLKNGAILLHLASPTIYPTQGTESLDLINVRAYAKNTSRVIVLSNGDSYNYMQIEAINTITASGLASVEQNSMVIMPNRYNLNALSSGNTCDKLN